MPTQRPNVQLITRGKSTPLTEGQLSIIDAGLIMIVVSGSGGFPIMLDGTEPVIAQASDSQIVSLDLSRSTGFHHLRLVPSHNFWFGTQDSKARLDGVVTMLEALRAEGLSWSGQLMFSDGHGLLDDQTVYGWLARYADEIRNLLREIAYRPTFGSDPKEYITEPGAKRPVVAATLRFIKRRGNDVLLETDRGPLQSGGKRYAPRKVITRRRFPSLDTLPNRRAAWLADEVIRLALAVASSNAGQAGQRCLTWASELRTLTSGCFLSKLKTDNIGNPAIATQIETIDPKYRRMLELVRSLSSLGWKPTLVMSNEYAFVRYADEIYQAFVAHMLSKALGLKPTHHLLGHRQPAFSSDRWSLYYNAMPPEHIAKSWRTRTTYPDGFRPDVVLHDRSTNEVVICDAKYRLHKGGPAESGRKELMAYMDGFGIDRALLCYPGRNGRLSSISHETKAIVELGISPNNDSETYTFAEAVDLARDHPKWRENWPSTPGE